MNDLIPLKASTPIKMTVTRIEEIFHDTNPYKPVEKVIKDYVYTEEKRILA